MSTTPNADRRFGRPWRRASSGSDEQWPIDPDLAPDDPAHPSSDHRRSADPGHRLHPRVLVGIAAGGFIGAIARYGLGRAWPVHPGAFPWSTFVINSSGAF